MKLIADNTGRFIDRPFYEPAELDVECEKVMSQFLRSVYSKVDYPVSTDDLTADVDVPDVVSEKARVEAVAAAKEIMDNVRVGKNVDAGQANAPPLKVDLNTAESQRPPARLAPTEQGVDAGHEGLGRHGSALGKAHQHGHIVRQIDLAALGVRVDLPPADAAAEKALADALVAHCRQHLAHFKCPREIRFVELPKTSTGKIQKHLLRKAAQSASAI